MSKVWLVEPVKVGGETIAAKRTITYHPFLGTLHRRTTRVTEKITRLPYNRIPALAFHPVFNNIRHNLTLYLHQHPAPKVHEKIALEVGLEDYRPREPAVGNLDTIPANIPLAKFAYNKQTSPVYRLDAFYNPITLNDAIANNHIKAPYLHFKPHFRHFYTKNG